MNYGYDDPSLLDKLAANWQYIGAATVGLLWASSCLHGLNRNEAKVITSMFGKPKGVLSSEGLNVTAPWPLTRVFQTVSTAKQPVKDELYCKTSNNVTLNVPITTEYRIVDPEKFAYASLDPIGTMKDKVSRAVKSKINDLEYSAVQAEIGQITTAVKESLDAELLKEYGIELIDIIVDEPVPDSKIEEALNRREAAKLSEDAGKREGNAEALRIIELSKGVIEGAEKLNESAVKAGFVSAAQVIEMAQKHIAITDANQGRGNVVIDVGHSSNASFAAGMATQMRKEAAASTPKPS